MPRQEKTCNCTVSAYKNIFLLRTFYQSSKTHCVSIIYCQLYERKKEDKNRVEIPYWIILARELSCNTNLPNRWCQFLWFSGNEIKTKKITICLFKETVSLLLQYEISQSTELLSYKLWLLCWVLPLKVPDSYKSVFSLFFAATLSILDQITLEWRTEKMIS